MKKELLIAIFISICTVSAVAQTNTFSLQYSMGVGTGDMGSFISGASFRGAQFEWRRNINPTVGVGLNVAWNAFYKPMPNDTYTLGAASLTGKQYRYQNQVPILAAVDYYFSPDEKINPFIGLGVGTMYSLRDTQMYVYSLQQEAWQFAMSPEAGILYDMGAGTKGYLGVKYNMGFKSGDFTSTQSYVAINVGFVFGSR